ncbi:MFS transporter [Meiothermus sp. QL-1]|nr:MFS transporter [Meiothermus sp. QL-1]
MQLVPTLGALQVVMLLGNSTFAGLTTSLMGLARVLTAHAVGQLSDRWGRKVGLYLGLWLALAGSLLVGLATLWAAFALFVLGVLVFGAGVGAVQQMRVAAADMYPQSRRGEGLSLVAMGSLLGAGLAPLVVALAEELGKRLSLNEIALAWLLLPLLWLPGFGLVWGIRPDPRQIALALERYYPPEALKDGASLPEPRRAGSSWAAILTAAAAQGQMVMMMAMTALALKAMECSLSQISLSVALHVMGMFAFSWPIGRLSDRLGRQPVMAAGLGTAALGALLVGLGTSYGEVTLGTFLVGLGWSGAFLAANALLADLTPPGGRGQAVGVLEFWSSLAGVLLPLLGGVLLEGLGMRALGYFGALLVLLPLLLLFRKAEV